MQKYMKFNSDYKSVMVLCWFCICLYLFPVHVIAENDPNTSVSNESYAVKVVKEEKAEDSCKLKVFTLKINDKKSNTVNYVRIGGREEQIKSVENLYLLEGDKLVVHGKLKRADIIYLIDNKKHEVTDMFWCYDPVFSPSRHFLIYEKFYPYHGLKATQTTVVLIYDMEKSPLENRVPVKGYTTYPENQVGLPLYPKPYVEARAYVLPKQQQENPFWYLRSSPFFWSADANDVVFLCNHEEQTYIVRVNISAGLDKPKVFEAPINVGNFVKPELPEEYRKKEAARLHTLSATEILWDGKDHVVIKPHWVYHTLQDRIRLAIP